MGLRKKIIKLLDTPGLGVDACLCKIGELVRAPKKKATKPLGVFEIRLEKSEPGKKMYRINALSDKPLPISAITALQNALEGYKNQVAECDCAECEQLKSRGEV